MSQNQPDGYLATPLSGKGAGVLVLHPWWGLNDMIKKFCDRLANAGFVAFAPDLYHGKVTDTIEEADKLSRNIFADIEPTRADVVGAAEYLSEKVGENYKGLAVVGFSFGGFFALDLSNTASDLIHSTVIFYSSGPSDFSSSKSAYLGHFAEKDQFEPEEGINALEKNLKEAGRPVTFHRYPGTGHWFFEPDRVDAFNQQAADLAWKRTLEFLNKSGRE